MTRAAKIDLVNGVAGEFPVSVAASVLGLPRSTWYYQAGRISYGEKHAALKASLIRIARKHTEYGYRRSTDELTEMVGEAVNHKVVQNLHRLWDLPLLRGVRSPRPSGVRRVILEAGSRANLIAGLGEVEPFDLIYTDFTELVYARGKAQLMPMVDHVSKVVTGWALGEEKSSELALEAWRHSRRWLKRNGMSPRVIIVHHDQDPIYTSYGWTGQLLVKDGARISYALNGAKDNPEMESFNSRFKNENRSLLLEADTFEELKSVVARRIRYYNRERRHSTLGNIAPMVWLRKNWTRG